MEKCCGVRQATDDNRAHVHCMLAKAADAHTEHVILLFFYCCSDYTWAG